jgi:hypothetical protein
MKNIRIRQKQSYLPIKKIFIITSCIVILTLLFTVLWGLEYQKNIFVKTQFDHLVEYRKSEGITVEYNNKEFRGSAIVREWSGTF